MVLDIQDFLPPQLFQLEFFFPSIAEPAEVEWLINEVACLYVQPAVVNAFYDLEIEDETAFCASPVPCLQAGCAAHT